MQSNVTWRNADNRGSEIQQIVGRERRERVSQLTWCGEGCFGSRRRVNSDVGPHVAVSMGPNLQSLRRAAAEAGRAYLANNLSWEQFMQAFSECDDDLVGELVTLIEHEPKRAGI